MTDHDEIADLFDRIEARQRRGEDWEFEFELEFAALTGEEQDAYIGLVEQRTAHGKERLEAIEENVRILKLLFLYKQGYITVLEFVPRVRGAVPDPLAE
jgi:hypothetical protein